MNPMTKTILLVEDVNLIALCESRLLQSAGYNVIHVNTGETAISFVRDSREAIDLILMDIELGEGINGIDAASEIMEYSAIPVIFLTSHEKFEVEVLARNIRYAGYLYKGAGVLNILGPIRDIMNNSAEGIGNMGLPQSGNLL